MAIPAISHEDFSRLVDAGEPGVVFVDARYGSDFRDGSIADSVNYPINCAGVEEERLQQQLSQARRIIVFCQSEICPFSEMIARRLRYSGCPNVAVFPGDIEAWTAR